MPTVIIIIVYKLQYLIVETGRWIEGVQMTRPEFEEARKTHKVPITAFFKEPSQTTSEIVIPHKPSKWGFVKGTYETGDPPLENAIRELQEETGLLVKDSRCIPYGHVGPASHKNQIYKLSLTKEEKDQIDTTLTSRYQSHEGEILHHTYVSLQELKKRMKTFNHQSQDIVKQLLQKRSTRRKIRHSH
jgi:8-oxo-dGTP pyrophosphatase MutT (NUDIX family)